MRTKASAGGVVARFRINAIRPIVARNIKGNMTDILNGDVLPDGRWNAIISAVEIAARRTS